MATLSHVELVALKWVNQSVAEMGQHLTALQDYVERHNLMVEQGWPSHVTSELKALITRSFNLNDVVYELVEGADKPSS